MPKPVLPTLVLAVALIAAVLQPLPAAAASLLESSNLAPHRAFYSMQLLRGGVIVGAEGVMTMSLERTCDGWIFTQDLNALFNVEGGSTVRQTALFTSWESLDGRNYQFASKIDTDGIAEALRGTAVMDLYTGRAHYKTPEEIVIALPGETLFPVSHTAWLIAEAEAGRRQVSRVVFTGSEDLQPELINAFIGNPGDTTSTPPGARIIDHEMTRRAGWPLTMAFYEIDNPTGLPRFEMRALQLDNGVAPWLVMDFGEFATLLVAEKIEPIDAPRCS